MTFTNGREQPNFAYLNEVSEDYETTGDDPYLAACACMVEPPGYRPPPSPPAESDADPTPESVLVGSLPQDAVLGEWALGI